MVWLRASPARSGCRTRFGLLPREILWRGLRPLHQPRSGQCRSRSVQPPKAETGTRIVLGGRSVYLFGSFRGSSAFLVKPGSAKVFHSMDFGAIFSFALTGCK